MGIRLPFSILLSIKIFAVELVPLLEMQFLQ